MKKPKKHPSCYVCGKPCKQGWQKEGKNVCGKHFWLPEEEVKNESNQGL